MNYNLIVIFCCFTKAIHAFIGALSRWQKSDFHLVKVHAMSHFSDAIQRSGLPFEYSSNLYEYLHIALMKATYKCNNQNEYINYIVKHNRRLQVLWKNAQEREGFAPIVEKTTIQDLVCSRPSASNPSSWYVMRILNL